MALTSYQKEYSQRSKLGFPIDRIKNDSKFKMEIVLDCYELTWNCPATHATDFGRVFITYTPYKFVAETKALKIYLQQYRNRDCFNEELSVRILCDFIFYIQPEKIEVKLAQNPRGGIGNTSIAKWDSNNDEDFLNWKKLNYTPKKGFRGGWAMVK